MGETTLKLYAFGDAKPLWSDKLSDAMSGAADASGAMAAMSKTMAAKPNRKFILVLTNDRGEVYASWFTIVSRKSVKNKR